MFAPDMGCHVYSIRIRLLTLEGEGYSSSSRDFSTFQLMTREWKLLNRVGNDVHEVTGDGVIGIYSLLSEGNYLRDSGNPVPNFSKRDIKIRPFKYQIVFGPIQG